MHRVSIEGERTEWSKTRCTQPKAVSGGIFDTRWASATRYVYLGFINRPTGTKDKNLNKKTMTGGFEKGGRKQP
jgi:hypothetical protein